MLLQEFGKRLKENETTKLIEHGTFLPYPLFLLANGYEKNVAINNNKNVQTVLFVCLFECIH